MMRFFTLILSLLAIHCFGQRYSKSWLDVDYAGDSREYHKLDIYLPEVQKPTYPVVVVVYGSAWFGNNLKGSVLDNMGKALLDSGFAVVAPNHRSSFDAKFPGQINDIKAVIRFIRANAEQYQLNTSFIGITGSSSGGHLAALAGTSEKVRQYTVGSVTQDIEGDIGPHLSYDSSVDAVVDWFGPTDFQVMDSCGSSMVHDAANSPESSLVGGPIQDNDEKCALANPITYVDENDPPFLILHGDADPLVPHCQSELLYQALQNADVPSQYILVPNAQHGPGLFEEQYYQMMIRFFKMQSVNTSVGFNNENLNQFSVSQNYPNPFNPTTRIRYNIANTTKATLKVFDILGKEIHTLVNDVKSPGQYKVTFDGQKMSSGVYYYRLNAGVFSETKTLVLLK